VLPPRVEAVIRRIEADHTSGAAHIASMGLEAIEALVLDRGPKLDPLLLREAARRIPEAQATNAALYNVVRIFAQLVAEGQDPPDVVKHLRKEIETARDKVARSFLKIAPEGGSVVTLTNSANVLACLRLLRRRGRLDRAYVMESRPLNEGRLLAGTLAEAGIPVTLVPDAAGPGLMAHATFVLTGADSVLRDGAIVNKMGTYAVALAAADHRRPAYVACETFKFDARHDSVSWPGSPAMDPSQVWDDAPKNIDVENRYFEVVPARLVTMVATERGCYAPDTIRTMLAQARVQG